MKKITSAFCVILLGLSACNVPDTSGKDLPAEKPKTVSTQAEKPTSSQSTSADSKSKACLAEAMYHEARGTGINGMRAVGEVIINRKNDKRFPNSICGVVNDRCQFSYTCDKIPDEVYREKGQKAKADAIADTLLTSRGKDITNGALYFHAKSMRAGWFGTLSRRGQFGGNIFYR